MTELTQQEKKEISGACINCANPAIVKGFPNALCEECRESFIKYPIPIWIKLFAGAILVILLFSLYKIPKNISIGMHLDKAETAIQQKKYLTAQKEIEKTLQKIPDNLQSQSNLLIASFYNYDYITFESVLKEIGTKSFDDEVLFRKVSSTVEKYNSLFPLESFQELLLRYKNDITYIPDTALIKYYNKNPNDHFIGITLANRYFEAKKYADADSLLSNIFIQNMDYIPALSLMAAVKRMESNFESSIYYSDKLLNLNKESFYALGSKSRTYLKQKSDKQALKFAEESYALNKDDFYSIGTLALVYHFTNKISDRDVMLKKLKAIHDSSAISNIKYVEDVISGKEFFRN